jgi:uncharacterized protein (TIGR02646 family)
MIQLRRLPEPLNLTRNKHRWSTAYLGARVAYQANPNARTKKSKEAAEKKYNKSYVKSTLKLMFHEKCAYCESKITHIDYGDIEHFRPKAHFPNLCFEWNNFLLSCGICNGKQYKSDIFPEAADGGPLINPLEENPDDFLVFEFDVQTNLANVLFKNPRGELTRNILGLNRLDLIKYRSSVIKKIFYVAQKALEGDADAINLLIECVSDEAEYAAFSRSIVQTLAIEL